MHIYKACEHLIPKQLVADFKVHFNPIQNIPAALTRSVEE